MIRIPSLSLLLALALLAWPASVGAGTVQIPPPEPPVEGGRDICAEAARLFQAERHQEAEPLLLRCLESEGERGEILVYLTVIALEKGKLFDAARWGERAVAADSASADARYWYGRALIEGGETTGAKRQWEAGIRLAVDHVGLLEGLARLALAEGEDGQAYGLLTHLQRQGVAEGWVHRLLSELAKRKGQWAEAARHLRDALAREGEDPRGLLAVGELSLLAGDHQGAVPAYERAVELEPSAETLGGLGQALFAADRHEEALVALRRAVDLDPEHVGNRFNLANLLEITGRVEEADAHFREVVRLDPDDPMGRINFGLHLEKLGRTVEALEQISEAVALDPSLLWGVVVKAQILEKLGRHRQAMALIDTLLAADSENTDQLTEWRGRVAAALAEEESARSAGKFLLLHIVTPDSQAVALIREGITSGVDFSVLATRYSTGTTAAQGGDIGWVAPADMVEPLRSAIETLAPDEISPLVEARGLYHFFKRVR